MAQKTHPIGFRLGIIKDWQSRWFAASPDEYRALVKEDMEVRDLITGRYPEAGISKVEIERGNDVIVTVHTARPGIVIGRGGQRVEELRKDIEAKTAKRARLNVQEIRQPELDAYLVARNVAEQLERRIVFRRAIRQTVMRTMQAGAEGIKILIAGRLGGADIARREKAMEGRVPLHTLRADIDYAIAEAATEFGRIGVKVWIYKGEIIPEPPERPPEAIQPEDIAPIEVSVPASSPEPAMPTAEQAAPVAAQPEPAADQAAAPNQAADAAAGEQPVTVATTEQPAAAPTSEQPVAVATTEQPTPAAATEDPAATAAQTPDQPAPAPAADPTAQASEQPAPDADAAASEPAAPSAAAPATEPDTASPSTTTSAAAEATDAPTQES